MVLKPRGAVNCSYCRMRGAATVSAEAGDISFDCGEEALTVYRFNTSWPSTTSALDAASVRITGGA